MKFPVKKSNLIFYVINISVCIIFLFPLYYTAINSIRPIFSTPAVLFPKGFEFVNYYYAVSLLPFFRYLKNSLIIVGIALSLGIVFNFFYGYAFARMKAPGKNLLFTITLAQLMIPGIAIQIPQYILFSRLGLKGTYWIWVLNGIGGNAFLIFLYRQFLMSISKDIEDAARIDGCSVIGMITRIFMPLSKPIIAVAIFFEFLGNWGDFMTPFMYLSDDKYPLAMALFGVNYILKSNPTIRLIPVVNAAAILLMIPTTVVFFICQKHLVEGLITSGIKG